MELYLYLPNATQAHECGPRTWNSTFLVDEIKYGLSLDKVCVATKGYHD